jgi:hypothetical protein
MADFECGIERRNLSRLGSDAKVLSDFSHLKQITVRTRQPFLNSNSTLLIFFSMPTPAMFIMHFVLDLELTHLSHLLEAVSMVSK